MNATALPKVAMTSVIVGLLFIACQQPSPTSSPNPAPSPTLTPSPPPGPALMPLPTSTGIPTAAPTATATLVPTSAPVARTVVIDDPTGDWAYPAGPWLASFGFPPPKELGAKPLPIPFIDLRSVTIRVDGDNLVIKYQVTAPLPTTKEEFPVIEGQPITAFVIRMPIDVDRQRERSEVELFNGWSVLPDGRLHQDVSYLLDPVRGGGNEPFQFYSKKSARLLSGGPGHDYLEVSYPLDDLGLRADQVISMEVFAFASNGEQRTVSADFLDVARCEGQGGCYDFRLGSGLVREPPVSSGAPRPPGITTLPSCGTKRELFSVSPFPISLTISVMPLGSINPPGHTIPREQLEFFFPRTIMPDGTRTGPEATVVAPTDMVINLVRVQREPTGEVGTKLDNYKLFFSPCREVIGYMVHLTTLAPKLLEQLVPPYEFAMADMQFGGSVGQAYEKVISLPVEAGEVLGTYGPAILGGELSLRDYRTPPLPWANPSRWPVSWLHGVCPLDYFTVDVRSELWAKLGIFPLDGRRYASEPTCGEVAQDVSGTAKGVWYVPSPQWSSTRVLSLIHDVWDPAVGVFSVGFSLQKSGVNTGSYHFAPTDLGLVNRDFKEVTADGQVYCYEVYKNWWQVQKEKLPTIIILQLTSSTTLRVEGRASSTCGSGPWQFGTTFTDFER